MNNELLTHSPEEIKKKYPGGVYIEDPLSENCFIEGVPLEDQVDESMLLSADELDEMDNYEIIFDGRLDYGIEELKRIEESGNQELLQSMYYINLKSRVKELTELRNNLIAKGLI